MTEERRIADPYNYDDLIEAFKTRAADRGVSYAQMDEVTGLPAGYTGKVFGKSQTKRLSAMSLDLYVTALGLRMVLVEDAKSLHAARHMLGNRHANQARTGNSSSRASSHVINRVLKHFAPLGGLARWRGSTKEQRSNHGRMMVAARDRKRRAARRRAT